MAERMCNFKVVRKAVGNEQLVSSSRSRNERLYPRLDHAKRKIRSLPPMTEQMVSQLDESRICDAETSRRQKVRQGDKASRDLRMRRRADHVHIALLRARVPSDRELDTTKELLQICVIRGVEVEEEADEEESETDRFKNFEDLKSYFLKENLADLESAGLGALTAAPISAHIQRRFLSTCNEYGEKSLVLGYHGTPTRNHSSIFESGLRVPGKGSVRIANGNAHGRGVYIAEKGNEMLSRGFLKGDTEMLVCGVIDNTLVDEKELNDLEHAGTKLTRFLFRGSYLEHRCHRRPVKATSLQTKQQQYLGMRPLYAETKEVRHVGNAMVIFNEKHVAPLFVAHMSGSTPSISSTTTGGPDVVMAPEPRPNVNRLGQVAYSARGQVVDPRSHEQCWLAPEASSCKHGIKVKRDFEKRSRQLERRCLRESKYHV